MARFLAGLLLLLSVGACEMSMKPQLVLAVSPEEPAPSIGQGLADFFGRRGYSLSLLATSGADEIFEALAENRVDLALIEEPDFPRTGIDTLAPLYPSVLHVLHNRSVEPNGFGALVEGAKIYAGPVGGAAHRLLMELAEDFGYDNSDYEVLDNPWTIAPDVYFVFGGLLSNDSVRQLAGYRLFSFGDASNNNGSNVADGIVLRHARLRSFVLPASTYNSLSERSVLTLATRSVLIARADFDPGLAQEIAAQLFENAQELGASYPLVVQELNTKLDPSTLIFPLHPGSRRYLDRDKPSFIERYVEILALLLTLVLTLLSGVVWLYRYRQQVRKDRVEAYYEKILAIRRKLGESNSAAELERLKKEAVEIQEEVLELVVNERIDADTSLTVFLTVSNQVIGELQSR